MALTLTAAKLPGYEDPELIGRTRSVLREITLAGTYVTNGHAYTAAELGIPNNQAILSIEFTDAVFRLAAAAVMPYWDRVNRKIMFFWTGAVVSTATAEVTNATSLAGFIGKVRVRYRG